MTKVSSMLCRATLALALSTIALPLFAADAVPGAALASPGTSSDVDSAALADLPLETLMRLAVVPTVPALVPLAPVSEVYALRYVAPGVDQGVPQETLSQERVALFSGPISGF
ncbi:hypothetical protein FXN63_15800 [Pigmentiphaga aceris]|uniref:Secreted protein n=1 Tax=Pigmentiphaga aceris TaxID=1940612 RepID=A0A5C0B1V4_9BURK|nr:hypothetical protein [Pigmentiphaga aceris]QEI07140.1 hypothetical protein FXN63_15800 [Pigmentiphaga aceris]